MPPVATIIRKHAGEVAHSRNTGSRKWSADIGIGPRVPAVAGAKNVIGVVMRETSPAFVHPGDVYVACDRVAGDLHVSHEGTATGDLVRSPGVTIVGGDSHEEGASADMEVVPGNVHVSVMGRGWVVIHPTRLAVGTGPVENAVMDPAGRRRVPGSGRLVTAQARTATDRVEPCAAFWSDVARPFRAAFCN